MKTLKLILIGACLFAGALTARADKTDRTRSPYTALQTYVAAIGHGNLEGLDQVIDQSATFSMMRNGELISHNRADILWETGQTAGIEQNCRMRVTIVSTTPDITIARVDMLYPHFTRSNFVTLSNIASKWKITNVYSVFK